MSTTFSNHWLSLQQASYKKDVFDLHLSLYEGSMTELMRKDGNDTIELLDTGFQKPLMQEAQKLHYPREHHILTRTVFMKSNSITLFARSATHDTLYWQRIFSKQKSTPLGKFLFSQPHMQRSTFDVAWISSESDEGKYITKFLKDFAGCYARRSIFKINKHPLLLTEYFITYKESSL